jgi:hypothetical protein
VGGWVDVTGGPGGTHVILSVPLEDGAGADTADDEPADERSHDPSAWTPL